VESPATGGLVYQPPEGSTSNTLFAQATTPGTMFAGFNTITPTRVLDTRSGIGAPVSPLQPAARLDVQIAGVAPVPADATTVVLNVTATDAALGGYLTVWPAGQAQPGTSNVNFPAGKTVPNLVIAKLGGGKISIFNDTGTTHVIADVLAFGRDDGHLVGINPYRLLDTRAGLGAPKAPVGEGQSIETSVVNVGGIPAGGVGAVVLNVTATNPTAPSYVTVWPSGVARPNASSLNMMIDQTVANLVIAPVGTNGKVSFFNEKGSTNLIADAVGWLPAGAAYLPVTPTRVMDTRTGLGSYGIPVDVTATAALIKPADTAGHYLPLGPRTKYDLDLRAAYPAYGTLSGYVFNVTVAAPTAQSYLTVYPAGIGRPNISNLNTVPDENVPNSVVVKVGTGGRVSIYNQEGNAHVLVDLVGVIPLQNSLDTPDDSGRDKFHAVYVLGSDSGAADPDMVGNIQRDVGALSSWFQSQTAHPLNIDRKAGQIEVTTWKLPDLTKQQIAKWADDSSPYFLIALIRMAQDGFGSPYGRRWLFVLDTRGLDTASFPCGVAFAQWATVFTNNACAPVTGTTDADSVDGPPKNSAQVALHEMIHTLGAVPSCATHYDGTGHVSDDTVEEGSDLMYPTAELQPKSIDPHNDDYFNDNIPGCPDVAESPFVNPTS
jgi:hypothetical protein